MEKPLYGGGGAVLVDNYVGATAALRHLIELGHEHVGFIGEPPQAADGQVVDRVVHERLQAYRDALRAQGLPADESLVILGEYHTDAGWPSLRTGYDYMTRLLDQHPAVTAVVAASDLLAAGALQALYERRIRVPDEASVIGFDDTFAGHLAPPLTTVRQPMFEMGAQAAALALDLAGFRPGRQARDLAPHGARRPRLHRRPAPELNAGRRHASHTALRPAMASLPHMEDRTR